MNMLLPPSPRRRATFALAASLFLATPSMAAAGDPPAPLQSAPAPVPGFEGPAFAEPLAADALDTLRGGDQVENKVDIHGTVEDNTAENIISGDNLVQGGAFGNAAGINTLIQNSGSNVLIQNGMTVSVQFADPGAP